MSAAIAGRQNATDDRIIAMQRIKLIVFFMWTALLLIILYSLRAAEAANTDSYPHRITSILYNKRFLLSIVTNYFAK